MGTIDTAIATRLRGYAGLAALVGTRVYPWPAPAATGTFDPYPCVTYWQEHGKRKNCMGGPTGLVEGSYQIDILAETASEARDVADQVRLALNGFYGVSDSVEIDYVCLDDEDADPFQSHMPDGTKWLQQYYTVHWREATS